MNKRDQYIAYLQTGDAYWLPGFNEHDADAILDHILAHHRDKVIYMIFNTVLDCDKSSAMYQLTHIAIDEIATLALNDRDGYYQDDDNIMTRTHQ